MLLRNCNLVSREKDRLDETWDYKGNGSRQGRDLRGCVLLGLLDIGASRLVSEDSLIFRL